jgi:NADH:ubiquinone oxidoreductase subunit 4 (subunit M)
MRGTAGVIGVFLPILVLLLASWGPVRGRTLWLISLFISFISAAAFLFLTSGFYLKIFAVDQQVSSLLILEKSDWFTEVGFRWTYFTTILSAAISMVVVCFHFLGRNIIENSRASTGALAAFLCCILGGIGSGNLFLFTFFYAGTLLPRFIFSGVESNDSGVVSIKEISFLQTIAVYALFVIVLIFSQPFRASLDSWLGVDFGVYEIRPGAVGFLVFLLAFVVSAGLFPFHGNLKKLYSLDPIVRAIPLSVYPALGMALVYQFAGEYFSKEIQLFSKPLCAVFSIGLLLSAINFWGAKGARLRVFWLQQAMSCLAAVGFFSLTEKGWHGAATLIFFQVITIPFLLMILDCHERRVKIPLSKIAEFPFLALSTVTAVLVGLLLPISIGFYGAFLVVWGLVDVRPWYLYLLVLALPILILSGIQSMFFQLGERSGESQGRRAQDFSKEEMFAILPLGLVLLLMGMIPKIFLDPLGNATITMLKKIGMGE